MITFYNFRFEPVKALTLTSLTLIIIHHLTLITTPFTLFLYNPDPIAEPNKSDSPLWYCLKSPNERFKVKGLLIYEYSINSVIRSELIASKDGLSTENIRRCYENFFGKVSKKAFYALFNLIFRNLVPIAKLMSGCMNKRLYVVVTRPKTSG